MECDHGSSVLVRAIAARSAQETGMMADGPLISKTPTSRGGGAVPAAITIHSLSSWLCWSGLTSVVSRGACQSAFLPRPRLPIARRFGLSLRVAQQHNRDAHSYAREVRGILFANHPVLHMDMLTGPFICRHVLGGDLVIEWYCMQLSLVVSRKSVEKRALVTCLVN